MIILEGRYMLSKDELHAELKSKLDFPSYYGANLDALSDCLTGWIDLPVEVEWRDFSLVEGRLGEYARQVLKQFQEVDGIIITEK